MAKMKRDDKPKTVIAGQLYQVRMFDFHAREWRVVEVEASASCGGKFGQWVCTTHPKAILENNMQKDSHLGSCASKHVLGWNCTEHGLEVP